MSWSSTHTEVVPWGSIAMWCWAFWETVVVTVTGLDASAASMDATSGASFCRTPVDAPGPASANEVRAGATA